MSYKKEGPNSALKLPQEAKPQQMWVSSLPRRGNYGKYMSKAENPAAYENFGFQDTGSPPLTGVPTK
jgi:hypothetical protein